MSAEFDDVLNHFDTAMLVTRSKAGELRARPMAIAGKEPGGTLYFMTSETSEKIAELLEYPEVNVAMQSASRYLSISGEAQELRDRSRIEAFWKPVWKVWFPKGKDDPDLTLIKVASRIGEYWDQTGTNRLEYAFEAGKALLKGERLQDKEVPGHAKVDLQ